MSICALRTTSGNLWPALRRLRAAKTSLLVSDELECEVILAAQGLSFRPSSPGEREGFLVPCLSPSSARSVHRAAGASIDSLLLVFETNALNQKLKD